MFSAFEQFEVIYIISGSTNVYFISWVGFIWVIWVWWYTLNDSLLGSNWEEVFGLIYEVIWGMVKDLEGVHLKGIGVLFLYIICMNLIGLVPYSYALSSQLIVTFSLGLGMWIGNLWVGLKSHGWEFIGLLLPGSIPFGMSPFFSLIEWVGYVIPGISISVRLFANILSGHVLIHVLFGFSWLWLGFGWGGWTVLVLCLLCLLIGLEWSVSIIQAFVFSLLVSVYLKDSEEGGH